MTLGHYKKLIAWFRCYINEKSRVYSVFLFINCHNRYIIIMKGRKEKKTKNTEHWTKK